jgi:hypothetical protein
MRFYTTYRRHHRRQIRFDDFTWHSARRLVAYEGACDGVTVKQHYFIKHSIWLQHPRLPCVVQYGPRGHNRYFPIELLVRA